MVWSCNNGEPGAPDETKMSRVHDYQYKKADLGKIRKFQYFCREVVNSHLCIILVWDYSMILSSITPMSNSQFALLSYPFIFVSLTIPVSEERVPSCPKNSYQFSLQARYFSIYLKDFRQIFSDHSAFVEFTSFSEGASSSAKRHLFDRKGRPPWQFQTTLTVGKS